MRCLRLRRLLFIIMQKCVEKFKANILDFTIKYRTRCAELWITYRTSQADLVLSYRGRP